MKGDPLTEAYLREATSWDMDRATWHRRSARAAWRVAGAACLCAISAAVALAVLMPLKRVEPYLVRIDRSTGVVDTVPVYAGTTTMDEAVTRYFLTHYIATCERYTAATAESDYEECGAFHSAQRNQAWASLWNTGNPSSPLNLHKDGSSIRAQIESLNFFKRANGVVDLAQVRFSKAERANGGSDERVTHWVATIQFHYTGPSQDPRQRLWNPLGFRIQEFAVEPEVALAPRTATTSAASKG